MQSFIKKDFILNSKNSLIGYELKIFNLKKEEFKLSTFKEFNKEIDLNQILKSRVGFIRADRDLIKDRDFLDKLNRNFTLMFKLDEYQGEELKTIFEELKSEKFSLGAIASEEIEKLKKVVKYLNCIEVDFQKANREFLKELKNYSLKLFIRGIETQEEFEKFKKLHFNYFDGDFFLDSTVNAQNELKPNQITIFNTLSLINQNAKIDKIVEKFRQNPTLSIELLKVINSSLLSLRNEISSIRQAITLLGMEPLKKWLMFMVYLEDSNSTSIDNIEDNATIKFVLKRAVSMEEFGAAIDKNLKDSAFMVGLLSLIEKVLKLNLEDIFKAINLKDEIKDALTKKEGKLGEILQAIELLEVEKFKEAMEILSNLNIDLKKFIDIQNQIAKI